MNFEPDSRTIVVQSFRRTDVPAWIARCLESAKLWAKRWNYDYAFYGDEFYDLCGADYLARADGNPRTITNLARLEITRIKLWEGYDRVIWLDADVFVFDPARLTMQTDAGYAFSQQVWATAQPDGSARMDHASLHNATFVFTRKQTDLELFIHIIRHTVKTRELSSSAQNRHLVDQRAFELTGDSRPQERCHVQHRFDESDRG